MRRLLLALGLLAACSSSDPKPDRSFPKGFVFGAAIAGFQVDMGCPTVPAEECEDRNSDWYQWITDARLMEKKDEIFFTGGPPSTGPGFYELYADDFARAKNELKLGSVRLSIEWSRIFPQSTVGVTGYEALKAIASAPGIAYYHRQFQKMKELGLTPLVTLNHYTLPLWIHDGAACHFSLKDCQAKGWLDPKTIDEIAKYAGFVAKEFGGEVDLWATENEPLALPLSGYLSPGKDRSNPPGLSLRAAEAKTVTMALITAHARMYDAVKANDTADLDGDGKPAQIGLVYNMAPVVPTDPDNPDDDVAAKNTFYLYDELFLNAVVKGQLDADAAGADHAQPKADLVGRMDYLGINYYTRITASGLTSSILPDFSPLLTLDPLHTRFNEDYPRGIYEMIMYAKDHFPQTPIYITENGVSGGAEVGDARQEELMVKHVAWVQKAIQDGADVRGYFWWTLMDNYEWNHGMNDFHFGLYKVDPADPKKARTLRTVGQSYARIVGERKIPDDFAAKYPIQ